MLSDFENKCNQEDRNRFEALGFNFEITINGYTVHYLTKWVHGASVLLPREKSLHGKQAIANIRDNLNSAISIARSYYHIHVLKA